MKFLRLGHYLLSFRWGDGINQPKRRNFNWRGSIFGLRVETVIDQCAIYCHYSKMLTHKEKSLTSFQISQHRLDSEHFAGDVHFCVAAPLRRK